jgi:hypothetical protein
MDKKVFVAIADEIIKAVAEKNGITEGEARSIVGMTLRVNAAAVVDACVIRSIAMPSAS